MLRIQCLRCRAMLRDEASTSKTYCKPKCPERNSSTSSPRIRKIKTGSSTGYVDVSALLSKPSWSVRSLVPSDAEASSTTITTTKLHHLLRLSALPLPSSSAEESKMISTLQSQLHFVEEIQKVDTEGVEPLQALRDETDEGLKEITIGVEDLKGAFEGEDIVGKNRRPRRRRRKILVEESEGKQDETEKDMAKDHWDVLGTAERSVGRYFVVDTSNGSEKITKNPT